jgi:Domain of unknown function (DUF4397)
MQHRKWLVSLALAGLVTASVVVSAGATTTSIRSTAVSAPGAAPGVLSGTALLRVAHLSPDTAGVDVYLDGQRALGNVNYQTVSNYQAVPAGKHRLELRPAGAAASTKPLLDTTRDLASQQAYTAAGVGENAHLRGQVFNDDLTSPAPGAAKLRVIHAAVNVAPVDIDLVGGPALGTSIPFASATAYAEVPAGRYTLRVRTHSDGRTVLTVPNLDLGAGIVYSVAAIGGTAQKPLQALPLVDARGVEVLPAGAVHTGAGGTASRPQGSTPIGIWLLGGGLALAAAMLIPLRRRRLA